jgi:hypothetical protein
MHDTTGQKIADQISLLDASLKSIAESLIAISTTLDQLAKQR